MFFFRTDYFGYQKRLLKFFNKGKLDKKSVSSALRNARELLYSCDDVPTGTPRQFLGALPFIVDTIRFTATADPSGSKNLLETLLTSCSASNVRMDVAIRAVMPHIGQISIGHDLSLVSKLGTPIALLATAALNSSAAQSPNVIKTFCDKGDEIFERTLQTAPQVGLALYYQMTLLDKDNAKDRQRRFFGEIASQAINEDPDQTIQLIREFFDDEFPTPLPAEELIEAALPLVPRMIARDVHETALFIEYDLTRKALETDKPELLEKVAQTGIDLIADHGHRCYETGRNFAELKGFFSDIAAHKLTDRESLTRLACKPLRALALSGVNEDDRMRLIEIFQQLRPDFVRLENSAHEWAHLALGYMHRIAPWNDALGCDLFERIKTDIRFGEGRFSALMACLDGPEHTRNAVRSYIEENAPKIGSKPSKALLLHTYKHALLGQKDGHEDLADMLKRALALSSDKVEDPTLGLAINLGNDLVMTITAPDEGREPVCKLFHTTTEKLPLSQDFSAIANALTYGNPKLIADMAEQARQRLTAPKRVPHGVANK